MPKNQHIKEMNWGFLLFRGSYTYKKGLIVQSSSKTTQLLDPLFLFIFRFYILRSEYKSNNIFRIIRCTRK